MKKSALLFASTMLAAVPAAAQGTDQPARGGDAFVADDAAADAATADAQASQATPVEGGDHVHLELANDIVVTAPFLRDLNVLAGTEVLTGSDLVRDMRPQLGETLTRLPGVSATSFSPGASRPVLRGFQGERVRVLVDGIGSIDVSNTSADHAVTIDPLTAERIEVLHGPAALLFGSQAIGGAVNIFDRRIPRRTADTPEIAHVDAIATYGSAANERSVGAAVDVPIGGGFVAHVDGSYRNTDDLDVGGYVLSEELRAEQLEFAAEEEEEGNTVVASEARALANQRGRLPNSATETVTAGAGLALIRDNGNLGVSVSYYGSNYGVPARPVVAHEEHEGEEGHEDEDGHGHEHGDVTIDLEQIRADLRGEVNVGSGFLDMIRVRLGYADYQHTEFEGDEVGTVFETEGMEGRLELAQRERGGWRGVTGVQYFTRSLSAIGEEAFVPPNDVSQFGVFTLQELERGNWEIEAAARYERSAVGSNPLGIQRNFNALSAAVGASYEFAPLIKVGVNLSRAERAPSPEELFSDGPHIATQSYELGDPTLDTESAVGGELYARVQRPRYQLSVSVYYNRFNNFIYQAATGAEEDELPVFQYFQRDATHWGFEAGASASVANFGNTRVVIDGVADYTRATIEGGGPVPRIPPLRLLGGVEVQHDKGEARVEVERVFAQNRLAEFENRTDGFTLVNASVAWRPWGRRNPTSLVLSANNIFDVDARRHASFTREFVPLPGRDLRISARVSF